MTLYKNFLDLIFMYRFLYYIYIYIYIFILYLSLFVKLLMIYYFIRSNFHILVAVLINEGTLRTVKKLKWIFNIISRVSEVEMNTRIKVRGPEVYMGWKVSKGSQCRQWKFQGWQIWESLETRTLNGMLNCPRTSSLTYYVQNEILEL